VPLLGVLGLPELLELQPAAVSAAAAAIDATASHLHCLNFRFFPGDGVFFVRWPRSGAVAG
jgi:hypothetical protein